MIDFDTAALERHLATTLDGFRAPLAVERLAGGQSNPTYRLVGGDGARYVLRKKPAGPLLPSAHAVEREYRVTAALQGSGVPVPPALHLCEDASVIGTPFYVMAFVEGRVFWDPTLPDLTRTERAALYDDLNRVVARLHRTDPAAVGLADFGKTGDYLARQIARWSRQYRASDTTPQPAMERLIEWLPAQVPATAASSVVHGDLRMDNMIVHPTEPRIVAVLDWELSTLGDPLGDFSYHMAPWVIPAVDERVSSLEGMDLAALGIPTQAQYLARYCELTGRKAIAHMDFYNAYTAWRLAAIYQGIIKRVEDGTAASSDATTTTDIVERLAERAWEYAQGQRA